MKDFRMALGIIAILGLAVTAGLIFIAWQNPGITVACLASGTCFPGDMPLWVAGIGSIVVTGIIVGGLYYLRRLLEK